MNSATPATAATTVPGVNPQRSATVQASAGSGKTWLLVSRLLRLLLAGVPPSEILALTFTRKAAGEMQARLRERLHFMATCSASELTVALQEIGLADTAENRQQARDTFERLLRDPFPLRTSTFHSFCQDILQQFAFEAGLPSGFGLLEDETEVQAIAWQHLLQEFNLEDSVLTRYLQQLGSLDTAEKALLGFLHHRLDWWAFTAAYKAAYLETDTAADTAPDNTANTAADTQDTKNREPDDYQALFTAFFEPPESEQAVYAECWQTISSADLEQYAGILDSWGTKTGMTRRSMILSCVSSMDAAEAIDDKQRFAYLKNGVLTGSNTPFKYSENSLNKAAEKIGLTGELFFTLHDRFAKTIHNAEDQLNRLHNYQLTLDWLALGQRLLGHYQRIKQDRGVLDFADLEWHAVQLLNNAELSEWVQYKLDQRLTHILIDEFQDTSPTQWALLAPILQELVNTNPETAEQPRSIFIVGDDKQSIYGFRRADPALLGNAVDWVKQHTQHLPTPAEQVRLSKSRRSAAAIMQAANAIFADNLPDFPTHDTHQTALWGHVTLLPAIAYTPNETVKLTAPPTELRNPLTTPRVTHTNEGAQQEARQIATTLKALLEAKTPIQDGGQTRPARYGDVMILLRRRTHAEPIEQALRQLHIPFIGADRDSFASSIEIQDMQALLRLLHSPWHNLACAQVLRSPLFAWDDQAVMALAHTAQTTQQAWLTTLLNEEPVPELSTAETEQKQQHAQQHTWTRARDLLGHWQQQAKFLPTHDLLDSILHHGSVLPRYRAAFPNALHARLEVNFQRLCRLALATDGGRYPSLRKFNDKISRTEAALPTGENAVRIMTIHAAKGLESPIVFVANTASSRDPNQAWQPLVHWPADHQYPQIMTLRPSKLQQDELSAELAADRDQRDAREQLNLLYVALTRAKQYCYVSGFRGKNDSSKKTAWYDLVANGLRTLAPTSSDDPNQLAYEYQETEDSQITIITGVAPDLPQTAQQEDHQSAEPNPLDTRPNVLKQFAANPSATQTSQTTLAAAATITASAPSQIVNDRIELDGSADGRKRGIAIHALLEKLTEGANEGIALAYAAAVTGINSADNCWHDWLAEVHQLLQNEPLHWIFTSSAPTSSTRHDELDSSPSTKYDAHIYQAWNELPVFTANQSNHSAVYGVVDRVVVINNAERQEIACIDYKTQRGGASTELINHYRKQMAAYRYAIKQTLGTSFSQKNSPLPAEQTPTDLPINCYLLFTATGELVEVHDEH